MFFSRKKNPEIRVKIDKSEEKVLEEIFGINHDYYDNEVLQKTASAGKRVYRLSYRILNVKIKNENGSFAVIAEGTRLCVKPDRTGSARLTELLKNGSDSFRLQVLGGDYKIFLCDHDYNDQLYPVYDRKEKYEGILIPE